VRHLVFSRPAIRALALVGIAVALTGCLSAPQSGDDSVAMTLLHGGRLQPVAAQAKREITCPYIQPLDGTVSYRAGATDSARGVTYQSSLTNAARECSDDGATIRIKVGVQGRIILGEGGRPGGYTAPVRIAVRKGDQTVYSKLHQVPVSVPADDTHGIFTVIDDAIALPISATVDPGDEYKILIGLDPQGRATPRNRRR
jgi:hypothetical protein